MKVDIVLKSISAPPGEIPDAMELITEGELLPATEDGKNGWEIQYSDSEITGYDDSTTVVRAFGTDMVTMHREGELEHQLMIETGKKHHCDYNTEYGRLMLGIYTHKIFNSLTENGGELYFKYAIDANGSLLSENEVYMEIGAK